MYIIHRKKGNKIYVYEVTSYRDENGKPKNRQKLIEKIPIINNSKNIKNDTNEERTGIKEEDIQTAKSLSPHAIMFSGKATNALGQACSIGKYDRIKESLTIKDVKILDIQDGKKIGVGTAKILRYAIAEFTKQNHSDAPKDKLNRLVHLDIKDFAEANGVDITSKKAMENFRAKLRKNLETLRQAGLKWTEKINNKEKAFTSLSYIQKFTVVTTNVFDIEFSNDMGEYLTSLPLIQYPRALYGLDDKNFNAFAMGEAMCIHYSMDKNIMRGTAGKLKVETLLKCTSFPTMEELKKHKWSWELLVKEPFENALDELTHCGFLKDWKYCYEGGIEISDEQALPENYAEFISRIVFFEINGFAEMNIRVKEITYKKAEQMKKITAKRKNKQNTDNH